MLTPFFWRLDVLYRYKLDCPNENHRIVFLGILFGSFFYQFRCTKFKISTSGFRIHYYYLNNEDKSLLGIRKRKSVWPVRKLNMVTTYQNARVTYHNDGSIN